MSRLFHSVLFFFIAVPALQAQMERTIYQVFEVDSTEVLNLDVLGFTKVQIQPWAGNNVMTEVNVQVWEASREIVNYFVDQGRYAFEAEKKDNSVQISTKLRDRRPFKTPSSGTKECTEITTLKIFVPDYFQLDGNTSGGGRVVKNTPELFEWESVADSERRVVKSLQRKK